MQEGEGGEAGSEERLAPYLAALSGDQTDMTRENVFVFVSVQPPKGDDASATQGTVLSLPRGSRVLDAIRAAEKWSSVLTASDGRNGRVVLRNGRHTSSHLEQLDNGDVVSILPVEAEDSTVGGEKMGKHFFQ